MGWRKTREPPFIYHLFIFQFGGMRSEIDAKFLSPKLFQDDCSPLSLTYPSSALHPC